MANSRYTPWTETDLTSESLVSPADIAAARADVERADPQYGALLRADEDTRDEEL